MSNQACSCGQQDLKERFRHVDSSFFLLQCQRCGQGITSPWPTEEQLDAAYSEDYYSSDTAKFNRLIETWTRFAARRRARSLLKKHGGSGTCRVLDYGCGRGVLLSGFREQGSLVYGAERAGSGFESLEDVHIATLEELVARQEQFDIVVIWHVLEHLALPKEDLLNISKLLAPGGSLFLEVPNFGSWQARLFGRHWFHLDFPRHLYHFTAQSLQRMLQEAGFTQVSIATYALDQQLYGFLQSALNAVPFLPHNQLYELLKRRGSAAALLGLLLYAPVVLLLLPLALLEMGLGLVAGKGAVLTLHARKVSMDNDKSQEADLMQESV